MEERASLVRHSVWAEEWNVALGVLVDSGLAWHSVGHVGSGWGERVVVRVTGSGYSGLGMAVGIDPVLGFSAEDPLRSVADVSEAGLDTVGIADTSVISAGVAGATEWASGAESASLVGLWADEERVGVSAAALGFLTEHWPPEWNGCDRVWLGGGHGAEQSVEAVGEVCRCGGEVVGCGVEVTTADFYDRCVWLVEHVDVLGVRDDGVWRGVSATADSAEAASGFFGVSLNVPVGRDEDSGVVVPLAVAADAGLEHEDVIVICGVDHRCGSHLLEVGEIRGLLCGEFGLGENWEEDGGQDGDDCDHHEELDQGKCT